MTAMARSKSRLSVLLFAIALGIAPSARAQQSSSSLLAHISEQTIVNTIPGSIMSTCLLIHNNGQTEIEVRRQPPTAKQTEVTFFRLTLPASYVSRLRNELSSDDVRQLPTFAPLNFYISEPLFHIFELRFSDVGKTKRAGFSEWAIGNAQLTEHDKQLREQHKHDWARSRTTLAPVVSWLHEVETLPMEHSPEDSASVCDTSSLAGLR